MHRVLIILFLVGAVSSCDYLKNLRQEELSDDKVPVARVGERFLYKQELEGLIPNNFSEEDSAAFASRYVENWVRKRLMLNVAEQKMEVDESEINQKIEDYRFELLAYAYEKQYISQNLDTVVTDTQIEDYYEKNKDNFQLRQNIVKGIIVKLPNQAKRMNGLKRMMTREATEKLEEIRAYAIDYADTYQINDSIWVGFDDLIENTPFVAEIPNQIQTVRKQKFLETSDSTHTYFMRILDYKISEDVSPLNFVRDQVEEIILNKRKMDIRKQHESEIRKQAEKNDDYEIFD